MFCFCSVSFLFLSLSKMNHFFVKNATLLIHESTGESRWNPRACWKAKCWPGRENTSNLSGAAVRSVSSLFILVLLIGSQRGSGVDRPQISPEPTLAESSSMGFGGVTSSQGGTMQSFESCVGGATLQAMVHASPKDKDYISSTFYIRKAYKHYIRYHGFVSRLLCVLPISDHQYIHQSSSIQVTHWSLRYCLWEQMETEEISSSTCFPSHLLIFSQREYVDFLGGSALALPLHLMRRGCLGSCSLISAEQMAGLWSNRTEQLQPTSTTIRGDTESLWKLSAFLHISSILCHHVCLFNFHRSWEVSKTLEFLMRAESHTMMNISD